MRMRAFTHKSLYDRHQTPWSRLVQALGIVLRNVRSTIGSLVQCVALLLRVPFSRWRYGETKEFHHLSGPCFETRPYGTPDIHTQRITYAKAFSQQAQNIGTPPDWWEEREHVPSPMSLLANVEPIWAPQKGGFLTIFQTNRDKVEGSPRPGPILGWLI